MTEAEAAENEAFEEAGATGSMEMRPFASYRYVKGGMERNGGGEIVVSAYLLAVRETRPPMEVHRDPEWFEPEEAKQALAAGRSGRYARELARVVDAAVARLTGRPL
jgi:8-oxo-dGTP pyrophosphatase MutT (NUDIX family)